MAGHFSSVVALHGRLPKVDRREVRSLDLGEFCDALDDGSWTSKQVVAGFQVLLYPDALAVCSPGGECFTVTQVGNDISH